MAVEALINLSQHRHQCSPLEKCKLTCSALSICTSIDIFKGIVRDNYIVKAYCSFSSLDLARTGSHLNSVMKLL